MSPQVVAKKRLTEKTKPFRCNIYAKRRVGGSRLLLTRNAVSLRMRCLALFSRSLEFVAGNPACQHWQPCRLRSEPEPESGDHGVAGKIHVWAVFITWLVIPMRSEILGLFVAPLCVVARKFDSFIDRKRRYTHARQAEMIRTVVMSGLRPRIGADRQMKICTGRLHHGIKRRALRAAAFHFFRP